MLGCGSGSSHSAVVQDTTPYQALWAQGSKLWLMLPGMVDSDILIFNKLG